MELPPRVAVVKRHGQPAVFVRTRDMPDAFSSARAFARSVEWVKRMMIQIHAYAFIPDLSPDREDERIQKFLEQEPAAKSRPRQPEVNFSDVPSPLDI